MAEIYVRDGFRCRYCGRRTIPTVILELLGGIYPEVFPFHRHWKGGRTHPAIISRSPVIDHVVPGSQGGDWGAKENLVTACWPCNAVKGDLSLEQLGWTLRPIPGTDGTVSSLITRSCGWRRDDPTHSSTLPGSRSGLAGGSTPTGGSINPRGYTQRSPCVISAAGYSRGRRQRSRRPAVTCRLGSRRRAAARPPAPVLADHFLEDLDPQRSTHLAEGHPGAGGRLAGDEHRSPGRPAAGHLSSRSDS